MKVFNLPRGAGKTVRMLYTSEFNNAPILCFSQKQKECLIEKSQVLGINIPAPITIEAFLSNKECESKKILIDEALQVLECLIKNLSNSDTTVLGCTLSDEEKSKLYRWSGNWNDENTIMDLPIGEMPSKENKHG